MTALLVGLVAAPSWANHLQFKAVYRDETQGTAWFNQDSATQVADYLTNNEYELLDAEGLRTWLDARIADGQPSVLVLSQDTLPDQALDPEGDGLLPSPNNPIRRYLLSGGRIVHIGDIPFYYHSTDGVNSNAGWADNGAPNILGFNTASAPRDVNQVPTITTAGTAWGLLPAAEDEEGIVSKRPAAANVVDVILATDPNGAASMWVKNFSNVPGRGQFVRLYDTDTINGQLTDERLASIQTIAEYDVPNQFTGQMTTRIEGVLKGSNGATIPATNINITAANGQVIPAATDSAGKYFALVLPGEYTITSGSSTVEIAAARVTAMEGQTTTRDLTVETLPVFTLDDTNSTWKALKATPPFYNAAYANFDFDDSAWEELAANTRLTSALSETPENGNWWERIKFTVPSDFPVERPARIFGFDTDARNLGIWVNGVPIGSRVGGNDPSQNNFMIPSGVLKRGDQNVVVVLGDNGGGDMGVGPTPMRIIATGSSTGSVQARLSGSDMSFGGVGGGVTLDLLNASGEKVGTSETSRQGVAQFLNVAPGTYRMTATGPLVDAGTSVADIQVRAGETAVVTVPSNPAKGLANGWLTQGGPWMALPEASASDLSPTQVNFNPGDDWQVVHHLGGDMRSGTSGLEGFEENADAWVRLNFTIPQTFDKEGRNLVLDDFTVDDEDVTYFNGTKIGETKGAAAVRSYTIPRNLVNFGSENVLAVLVHNGTGGMGIDPGRERTVRIAVAPGTGPTVMKGDLNGDGRVNVQDATLSLQIAVGLRTPDANQTAAGDVNGDGRLNVQDTTLILQVAVGVRPPF